MPAELPLLFHSSTPLVPSFAAKYSALPIAARYLGVALPPVLISLTSVVPPALPLLFHSSRPLAAVIGGEIQRAAHRCQLLGAELSTGLMSLMRTAPLIVPVRHSSRSNESSIALK